MKRKSLRLWILYSGFTQHHANANGVFKLREALLPGACNGYDRVWWDTWRANVLRDVEAVKVLQTQFGYEPHIGVYGYSYGGDTALDFCDEAARHNLEVEVLVLADRVSRPWWFLRRLPSFRSLLSRKWHRPRRVADTVKHVAEFYQQIDLPQGHPVCVNAGVACHAQQRLFVPHVEVDDHADVHDYVVKAAETMRIKYA